MNLSRAGWFFRLSLEVIKEPTDRWAWAGLDLNIGVFLVSGEFSKNREKQQKLIFLPLALRDPDGKLPWQHDHTASRRPFLAGPALTQQISLGFSDLGNITRVAFSHGWIVPEQFLWCIRHKHAFCQHQACLVSPPAFSLRSYIRYLLHGKPHFLFLFSSKFSLQAGGAITLWRNGGTRRWIYFAFPKKTSFWVSVLY